MFILVDKPKGITSHDVVERVRLVTGEKRIGHAGTLDPNASGLLILGIGRASTKKLSIFLKLDKEYDAEIFLGEERETDDVLGKVRKSDSRLHNGCEYKFNTSQITKVLKRFVGEQMQVPPDYSAVKSEGKKAYESARKGEKLFLKPRKIVIYDIKLLKYKFPILSVKTKVSSGTYIRAFARDFGRELGCGAFLLNLRRVKIGKYGVENAVELKSIDLENLERYSINEPNNFN